MQNKTMAIQLRLVCLRLLLLLYCIAPVAVNEVVDEVAGQEVAETNTMLVAEASATRARRIKKRKSGVCEHGHMTPLYLSQHNLARPIWSRTHALLASITFYHYILRTTYWFRNNSAII